MTLMLEKRRKMRPVGNSTTDATLQAADIELSVSLKREV